MIMSVVYSYLVCPCMGAELKIKILENYNSYSVLSACEYNRARSTRIRDFGQARVTSQD